MRAFAPRPRTQRVQSSRGAARTSARAHAVACVTRTVVRRRARIRSATRAHTRTRVLVLARPSFAVGPRRANASRHDDEVAASFTRAHRSRRAVHLRVDRLPQRPLLESLSSSRANPRPAGTTREGRLPPVRRFCRAVYRSSGAPILKACAVVGCAVREFEAPVRLRGVGRTRAGGARRAFPVARAAVSSAPVAVERASSSFAFMPPG